MYDRRVPILRGPNNSMNTGIEDNHHWISANHVYNWCQCKCGTFWFVEEIFAVPNHWRVILLTWELL